MTHPNNNRVIERLGYWSPLNRGTVLFSCLLVLALSIPAASRSPRVVESSVTHGSGAVDPLLQQIIVKFDQPMQASMSWHALEVMRPGTDSGKWLDDRTVVLNVTLEANQEYLLSLNGAGLRGFANTLGEPLEPVVLSFATQSVDGDERPARLTLDQNRTAIQQLRRAIDLKYSYRDRVIRNWSAHWKVHEPLLLNARTPEAFALAAANLMHGTEDGHVTFFVGTHVFPAFGHDIELNYNDELTSKLVAEYTVVSDAIHTGTVDGVGYLAIRSWSSPSLTGIGPHLARQARGGKLILDLRRNSGGSEPLARWVAGCFLNRRAVYAQHVTRDLDSPSGFSSPVERSLGPTFLGPRVRAQVAVLMGPRNMSSCESFLLMMRQVPNCKLIGNASRGSSGNPARFRLANGVQLRLPTWKAMDATGNPLEGVGIAPDIFVRGGSFEDDDPVLQAALQWLNSEPRNSDPPDSSAPIRIND